MRCNTHIYFKVRDKKLNGKLFVTVSNIVLLGERTVPTQYILSSVTRIPLASRLEITFGEYAQISDSFRVCQNDVWERCKELGVIDIYSWRSTKSDCEYIKQKKTFVPLITNSRTFQWELDLFLQRFDDVITTD